LVKSYRDEIIKMGGNLFFEKIRKYSFISK